jgi:cell division protein FtsB
MTSGKGGLSSINEGNRQRSTAEEENKKLKAKVEELSDVVSHLSSVKVS